MAGKRTSQVRPKSRLHNDDVLLLETQNTILRKKNMDLAKRLAEKEIECAQATRIAFQQQSFVVQRDSTILCFKEKFKRILNNITSMSVHLANVGQECSTVLQQAENMGLVALEETGRTSPNKTQHVKPMVGGHTILRPTINLPRVSGDQLARLLNKNEENVEQEEHDHVEVEEDVEEEEAEEVEQEEQDENSQLCTLDEEDEAHSIDTPAEMLQSETSSSAPLLSGVFGDVNVYVSPIRGHASPLRGNSSSSLRASTTHLHGNNSPAKSRNVREGNTGRSKSTSATQTPTETSFSSRPSLNISASVHENRNSIETSDVDRKDLSMNMTCQLPNASTFCNADIDTSYQSEFTVAENTKPDFTASFGDQSIVVARKRGCNRVMMEDDYDPLEGPSNLLNNTSNTSTLKLNDTSVKVQNQSSVLPDSNDNTLVKMDDFSMTNMTPNVVDNTSTPYTPAVGVKRQISQVTNGDKENFFPQQTPRNVTKRRGPKMFCIDMPKLNLSQTHCSVILERLPVTTLNALSGFNLSNISHEGSPKKLKRSRGRPRKWMAAVSSQKEPSYTTGTMEGSPDTSSNEESPQRTRRSKGRPRRSKAPLSLKEPSCRAKMRRSK